MQNFPDPRTGVTSAPARDFGRPVARRVLAALAAAGALGAMTPPAQSADVDVGVSVQISQPGVYGRIDIGKFPQPSVIVAQPVIVSPPRTVVVRQEPIYMWVPPGHRKNWHKHCASYRACGVPVVFVRDDWYDHHVRPHPKKGDRDGDHRHGQGRDDERGRGKDRD